MVARLKAAGAIVVGKTNGPCLWPDSVFPATGTRGNHDRAAGGSSTGPAVAVAAGLTPLDIAADTGGLDQQPAAFCGVFGMRPTEHRVPLTGTLFIDPIRKFRVLATAGPMARSVADLRLAMRLISGPDGLDPEVPPVPWRQSSPVKLDGLRVAYAPGYPAGVAPAGPGQPGPAGPRTGTAGGGRAGPAPGPGAGPAGAARRGAVPAARLRRRVARGAGARGRCGTT